MDNGGEGAKEEGGGERERVNREELSNFAQRVCFRPQLFALKLCSALPTSSGS